MIPKPEKSLGLAIPNTAAGSWPKHFEGTLALFGVALCLFVGTAPYGFGFIWFGWSRVDDLELNIDLRAKLDCRIFWAVGPLIWWIWGGFRPPGSVTRDIRPVSTLI